MDDYESLISTTDAELLKRAWRNEKAAPQILKFEAALVRRSRELIQLMVPIFIFFFTFSPNFIEFLFIQQKKLVSIYGYLAPRSLISSMSVT